MDTKPYWMEIELPAFPAVTRDLDVDVVVIGGGLTGITTAFLLKKAGVKVALIERQRCASADTGHTTAHLTYVTDTRLQDLVKTFGRDGAKAFWEAGAVAIDEIHRLVRDQKIDCDFQWVPGYLHAALQNGDKDEVNSLRKDANHAVELGFQAEWVDSVPYAHRPGVLFRNQAKFHPRKYLAALLRDLDGNGSYVFENSEASGIESKPLTVAVEQFKIRCQYVVIATHCPLMGERNLISATLFQSKLALYTSYVLGAKLPRDIVPEALFWDTHDPYHYLRIERCRDHDYAIFGGEDCKTGQEDEDTRTRFGRLEATLKSVLPMAVYCQWPWCKTDGSDKSSRQTTDCPSSVKRRSGSLSPQGSAETDLRSAH
jgi:glycine/D-amino acid oxidase-like deaminating enzyme